MKKHLTGILLVIIFIAGAGIFIYPTFSNYWNSLHQSRAIGKYEETLTGLTQHDYSVYFDEADEYNRKLAATRFPLMDYKNLEEDDACPHYNNVLDITGTGIMGYIAIPKINVEMPIYHGTSSDVLNVAAGHMEGSSIPVGGSGTHAVISAHRGLPSARLFTDLDQLAVGDEFTITMLDKLMTYRVDQILIVKPTDVSELSIIPGQDYVTLVTCTPYGINSHRILVRGTRVENAEVKKTVYVQSDMVRVDPLLVAPVAALPMLLVLLIILMIRYRRR